MNPDDYKRYVILLSNTPGAKATRELTRSHVEFLKNLDREGRLVLCGPFLDYEGGMVIIKASSIEDARKIASADPFVSGGAKSFELRTLMQSCAENNHLGVG